MEKETITLTFGEAGENHVGMEMIGNKGGVGDGFNLEDFLEIKAKIEERIKVSEDFNGSVELIDLKELIGQDLFVKNRKGEDTDVLVKDFVDDAHILIVRNGVELFLGEGGCESLYEQMNGFEWDRKYWDNRRQKVLNKHARANVCFDMEGQEPDYENKKGKVVAYDDVLGVKNIRSGLHELIGEKGGNLICEGNRYFDLKKCGIGWHGDSERKKVLAFRIGAEMPLKYKWFHNSKSLGEVCDISLKNGDMYIMSEKATGWDWKRRSLYTLRHSAGCDKYTKVTK